MERQERGTPIGPRRACAVVAVGLFSLAVYLACRGSSRPFVVNQSLASGLTLLIFAGGAAVCAWLAVAGEETWRRLRIAFNDWQAADVSGGNGRLFVTCLALSLCCQTSLHLRMERANRRPIEDQGDYLRVAEEVARRHGPLSLYWDALPSGRFTEANRHPAYVSLLAILPSFETGKGLSIGFALLLTVVAGIAVRREAGVAPGCLCVALLATNRTLTYQGSLVACESLLALLLFVAWFGLRCDFTLRRSLQSGAWYGLGYLTKASAFFVLIGAAIGQGVGRRSNLARNIAGLATGFLIVASPLLVRNVRVYGNPLYSFNNQFLFADDYDSGVSQENLGFRGNLRRYVETHSARQTFSRAIGGLATQAFVLCRSLGPAPLDSARAPVGAALLAIALASSIGSENRARAVTLLAWLAIFWLFFAWYTPIATSDRFWLPIVPPLLATASLGLARICKLKTHRRLDKTVCVLASGWTIAWCAASHSVFQPHDYF